MPGLRWRRSSHCRLLRLWFCQWRSRFSPPFQKAGPAIRLRKARHMAQQMLAAVDLCEGECARQQPMELPDGVANGDTNGDADGFPRCCTGAASDVAGTKWPSMPGPGAGIVPTLLFMQPGSTLRVTSDLETRIGAPAHNVRWLTGRSALIGSVRRFDLPSMLTASHRRHLWQQISSN